MSTQLSNSSGRKQSLDVFTMMLIVSALFLLIAVIAMIIEYRRYAPDYWKTSTARPNVSAHGVAELAARFDKLG